MLKFTNFKTESHECSNYESTDCKTPTTDYFIALHLLAYCHH